MWPSDVTPLPLGTAHLEIWIVYAPGTQVPRGFLVAEIDAYVVAADLVGAVISK
jgi:hypothetical protein